MTFLDSGGFGILFRELGRKLVVVYPLSNFGNIEALEAWGGSSSTTFVSIFEKGLKVGVLSM